MLQLIKPTLIFIVVGFSLHLAWESSHVPLYGGYEDLSPILPITVWASIGDILYMVGAVAIFSLFKKKADWISEAKASDFAWLALAGFLIALFVEYKALVLGRWHYLPAMPIIPILNVGLTPIIQMTVLLPLTAWITGFFLRRKA